jgi:uncharacterized protein YyaL (SSP411 family)
VQSGNQLGQSTSPYLRQHAENPVNWQEWNSAAFDEARERNVPVFLSIGYSACHWCHVMAHESFENREIADYLNKNFVSIKVDREERPDIDTIYMEATVAMTGHGGWPMSVFMDSEGRPFYTGTYFPPTPHHGLPSFGQLLTSISDTWNQKRADVLATGQRIVDALNRRSINPMSADIAGMSAEEINQFLRSAVVELQGSFDTRYAGFGNAPKFPPSMVLEFLTRMSLDSEVGEIAHKMAFETLEAMARGGMYDQIGGGFARYSVDAQWVVPHFEKMLYDNALLIRVYSHWWRLTGSDLAQRVVRESIEFLIRELRTDNGGFASALDADSEGVEGKFYAWSPPEIMEVFPEEGHAVCQLLNVTDRGTFEHGTSVLQLLEDPDDWNQWFAQREALATSRDTRIRPGRDHKVVAAWNGLAIAALAEAGTLFNEPRWVSAAKDAARTVLSVHLGAAGRPDSLARTSLAGQAGNNSGVLDDYANMADGLLTLYQVTGESEWRDNAELLVHAAIDHFTDPAGGFFDTADDSEKLIRRPKEFSDNAEPSGWFAIANAMIRLSTALNSDNPAAADLRARAEVALGVVPEFALKAPRAVGWGLVGLWSLAQGPWEVTVSGARAAEFAQIAMQSPLAVDIRWDTELPPGAQVCRNFVCELPTSDPSVLAEYLQVLPR